jgi:deoxyribonuclease IV
MWRALPPTAADIKPFRKARERFDLRPLVVHANYLINLASLDPVIREKSIAAFRGELERADMIGAEYLVVHPGHCKDCSRERGMAAFVLGLAEASRGLRLKKTMLLLENTVGQGSQLGSRFDELRALRDLGQRNSELRIGYCLDTCHLLASGFDIAGSEGLEATVAEVDAVLGLANVKVIHTNDSKKPLGSRVDRHANIGEGHIGLEGFRRILAHPRLHKKPFILETPVDQKGDDLRNMETLKNLCPKSSTATARSN